jgi:hypothetical protein
MRSAVARRNCYLDPKTWLLGAEWEDFIRSCETDHSLLDWTMMVVRDRTLSGRASSR